LQTHAAVNEIRGTIGNKGIARGIVAVVLRYADQEKVRDGMVLVAPETTPDYISIMAKCAAFVTDYGGITSHAAIVAREMGKPCIIDTKIATQVFKDGDTVEVDADTGIVRVLERAEDIPDPKHYEYLWSNFEVNYLFVSCYLSKIFREADIMLTYDHEKHELKYFLGRKDRRRIEKFATARYQSEELFTAWKGQIEADSTMGEELAEQSEKEKTSSKKLSDAALKECILERVRAFHALGDNYFFAEFFAVGEAEKLAHDNPEKYSGLKQKLDEMSHIKLRARGVLNKFYNYRIMFQPYTMELAKRHDRDDIEWLSYEEIANIVDGKSVPRSSRDSHNWVLAQRHGWKIIEGENAQRILQDFDRHFFTTEGDSLKGVVANKGVYRGTAKVLRTVFSDAVSAEVEKVQKGDILIASTTGPEVMAACERAGAIVTDEGGLTSHAAIVSRELKIPCIVGTKIATKMFKDGDMVEVDANTGVVRILK
jgi:phosphohistidine swiveling domain-containing protein